MTARGLTLAPCSDYGNGPTASQCTPRMLVYLFGLHRAKASLCRRSRHIWAAAEIYYLNSLKSCRSRFSGVYVVFLRCFRTHGAPTRNILVYTGVLPCLVSWWVQIVQIRMSFRSRSECWPFPRFFILSRFTSVSLVFVVFPAKVAHSCFCLVGIKMPLLI